MSLKRCRSGRATAQARGGSRSALQWVRRRRGTMLPNKPHGSRKEARRVCIFVRKEAVHDIRRAGGIVLLRKFFNIFRRKLRKCVRKTESAVLGKTLLYCLSRAARSAVSSCTYIFHDPVYLFLARRGDEEETPSREPKIQ